MEVVRGTLRCLSIVAIASTSGLVIFGCSLAPTTTAKVDVVPHGVPDPPEQPRVTDRPGNTSGRVLVLEYHRIVKGVPKSAYERSVEQFRNDLSHLHAMGFRPVTLRQYVENTMDIPPGASPVVITFDDSSLSQFRILPDGSIDQESAVGIWQDYNQKHPDFPIKATFFVLPRFPFGQRTLVEQKMKMLKQWGCEVGSHTMNHHNLSKLPDDRVAAEIAHAQSFVESLGFQPFSLALPYGVSPTNRIYLKKFPWDGASVETHAVVRIGARPALSTTDPKFNRYDIPRILAVNGSLGIRYWLDRVLKSKVEVYVQP